MHTTATKAKSPALWKGVLFWSLFSCIVIIFRGVRWDENYEFAQVILGQVPYPDAHPLAQYVHSFYSLQTWLLAALMQFVPGPLLANTLRNLLFLLATTVPVFLITSHLSQNRCSGHIATALVLLGVHIPFLQQLSRPGLARSLFKWPYRARLHPTCIVLDPGTKKTQRLLLFWLGTRYPPWTVSAAFSPWNGVFTFHTTTPPH